MIQPDPQLQKAIEIIHKLMITISDVSSHLSDTQLVRKVQALGQWEAITPQQAQSFVFENVIFPNIARAENATRVLTEIGAELEEWT